jgi:hypothetical protein
MLELITELIKLLQPNPNLLDIRKDRKQLRLQKKKIRIARRMYRQIKREFKKEGLTLEEKEILETLRQKILEARIRLIN